MADEPRRSGRATKGQHKPLDDADVALKPKKGAKAKASKKSAKAVNDVEEEEEEQAEVIRCVCGDDTDDEVGRKFVACDACEVWQHNVCMGVPLEDDQQPDHYFCERCRPEEHKELLEAMARGEKLWEERQKEAAQKGKKKGLKRGRKPGRPSKGVDTKAETEEEEKETPSNSQEAGVKRKFKEESNPPNAALTNGHAQDSAGDVDAQRADKRRKADVAESRPKLLDISLLPKQRQNVAVALTKLFGESIRDRVKAQTYRVPDGENADSLAHNLGQLLEHELQNAHGSSDKEQLAAYGAQFRALNANIKKNAALVDRLLNATLTAAELANMSTQDMASEKLQREREKMKEEADKQAVMLRDEEEKPRVRRTHKGDEYVDESTTDNAEAVFAAPPVRRRESELDLDGAGSPTQPSASAASPKVDLSTSANNDASRASLSGNRRQSSQNFDINSVWAKTAASPTTEQSSFRPPPPPTQNGSHANQAQAQDRPTGDADIDRLLADDDADDTYSPADAPPVASGVIWQGELIQPGVSKFAASARFVAGNDFSRYMTWESLMPTALEIEGRLERTKADDYMCGLQWSKKSDVTVLLISALEDAKAFNTIFDYFHSRKRYAVGKKGHGCSELIKDLYISPVAAGEQPPPHIDLLDFLGINFPQQEKVMLLTIVVNKPTSWDQPDAMPAAESPAYPPGGPRMSLPGPAASPINQSGASFSPASRPDFTSSVSQSAFPPNPYSVPPAQSQAQGGPAPLYFSPQVAAILGPYVGVPVAQQILAATNGAVQEQEAMNMREIFDRDARARDDMAVFGELLSVQPGR